MYDIPKISKFIEAKIDQRFPVVGLKGELGFNDYRVSVLDDEKNWTWIMVVVAEQCKCTECQ